MSTLFTLPGQFWAAGGNGYAGSKLYFYDTGTTTDAIVYADDDRTTAHAQPVVADSLGVWAPIYLDPDNDYKVVLTTSGGAVLKTWDPHPGGAVSQAEVGAALYPRTAAEIAASVTPSDYSWPPLDIRRYGAANGANSTSAIQTAINLLADGGTVTAGAGETYIVSATLDFTALGNDQAARTVDLNGATLSWSGTASTPVIKVYNNRFLTLRNFTIDGNDVSGSTGIFADSLQPLGTDHLLLDSFVIKDCVKGILLGSTTGGDQNRVSDSLISNFLIEGCTTGLETNSTNVDSVRIETGIFSGCTDHILLTRAGFLTFDTVTGYGGILGADTHFIKIAGPTDQLNILNCQAEDASFSPFYFLKRTDYTSAVDAPINLIGCAADNDIVFAAGSGSGAVVNIIGGYHNDLDVLADDLKVNLIGTRQKATATMTVNATNPFVRQLGSTLSGTKTITSGFFESIAANGYCTLPNGLILQWGLVTPASLATTTSRTDAVTLPVAFPTGTLSVSATAVCDGTSDVRCWVQNSIDASSFDIVVRNDSSGSAQVIGARWLAIGY